MYLNKNTSKFFSLELIIFSLISGNVDAGIVRVINENADPIILNVIPEPVSEESPYCWKCLTGLCDTPKTNIVDLIIPSECLIGKENFAVIGTTGGFLFNGKCRNLSVLKDYELTFLNDSIGTSCISKEI